jgi:aarF domain-containing kinase
VQERDGVTSLCLIDAGIVAELSRDDKRNFIDLFRAVALNDGARVAELLIERSRGGRCHDKESFVSSMSSIVAGVHSTGLTLGRVGLSSLLQDVLRLCYRHQVKLESRFVSVVVAIGIVEGLGRQLDPDIDILEIALPYILQSITE